MMIQNDPISRIGDAYCALEEKRVKEELYRQNKVANAVFKACSNVATTPMTKVTSRCLNLVASEVGKQNSLMVSLKLKDIASKLGVSKKKVKMSVRSLTKLGFLYSFKVKGTRFFVLTEEDTEDGLFGQKENYFCSIGVVN